MFRLLFVFLFAFGALHAEEEELLPIREYPNEPESAEEIISYRADIDPLNIISTVIFAFAVIHIFAARRITAIAQRIKDPFWSKIVHFFGEVEIIFGIWVIPLIIAITVIYGWKEAIIYLNSRDYEEAIAVVIVMTLASTYPILRLVEFVLSLFAKLGKYTPEAWWFTLLTLGPLLGSFITEAGAMTITALLLGKHVLVLKPSKPLAYATLGLLFTNVSIGGIATTFASPPAMFASHKWGWDAEFMLLNFGWKSALSIVVANLLYWRFFRKELANLVHKQPHHYPELETGIPKKVPIWVTLVNIFFLFFCAANVTEPVIAIGFFLFFLGFHEASKAYQSDINLRPALLVGFFIASLVIHAGLQQWWIDPLFDEAGAGTMLTLSFLLGPFTDNTALVHLATMIPNLDEHAKYAVMVGAVVAGGMTVIANAPNPAGQTLLNQYYEGGISPKWLFVAALPVTLIALTLFVLFWL